MLSWACQTFIWQNKKVTEFLKTILGRPVVVKLNSGVDYKGKLAPPVWLSGFSLAVFERNMPCVNLILSVGIVENEFHNLLSPAQVDQGPFPQPYRAVELTLEPTRDIHDCRCVCTACIQSIHVDVVFHGHS